MKYKENVGKIDQWIRYGVSIAFLILSFVFSLWFFIGTIVMFSSAYFKFCPIYALFNIQTTPKKP